MVELAGHSEGLNDIVWLHGHNNFVATASDDKTIKLWDIEKVLYKTLDIANVTGFLSISLYREYQLVHYQDTKALYFVLQYTQMRIFYCQGEKMKL